MSVYSSKARGFYFQARQHQCEFISEYFSFSDSSLLIPILVSIPPLGSSKLEESDTDG